MLPRSRRGPAGHAGAGRRAPRGALVFAAIWLALLLAAPPDAIGLWAFNGLRSVPGAARFAILGFAVVVFLLAGRGPARWIRWWHVAFPLALILGFALPERAHFLGDTWWRVTTIEGLGAEVFRSPPAELARSLHASPLDVVVSFLLPVTLKIAGLPAGVAISMVSSLLAVMFLAGAWRVVLRLSPAADVQLAMWLALSVSGVLQAFAGYAESAGLLLAVAAWWWAELLGPIAARGQAARAAGAWLVLCLGHRMGLLMLVPHIVRLVGPPLPGDRADARRMGVWLALGACVVAVGASLPGGGGGRLGADVKEALVAVSGLGRHSLSFLGDLVSALALVAPLAFLVPALAGRDGLSGMLGRPLAPTMIAAAAVLLPAAILLPEAPSGLGFHRDWDLCALPGWTLALCAAAALGALPATRARTLLAVALPVLAIQAGSWVAVNADEAAAMRRARAMESGVTSLPAAQRAHVSLYFGERAMARRDYPEAARYYERAFDFVPNANDALRAAMAWVAARNPDEARRVMARVRGRPFDASGQWLATRLDSLLAVPRR